VIEELQKNRKETTDKMTEGILVKMRASSALIEARLGEEIQYVRTQVEQVLREKEMNEQMVGKRKEAINASEEELKRIDQQLNELVMVLAQQ
jgi:hypothetical protein